MTDDVRKSDHFFSDSVLKLIQRHDALHRPHVVPDPTVRHFSGMSLESVGGDKLIIMHADGHREPLTGFAQYPGESLHDAVSRTATEMNATIIYEPDALQPYVSLTNMGGDECGMGLAANYPQGFEDENTISRADNEEWYRKEDVDALLLKLRTGDN